MADQPLAPGTIKTRYNNVRGVFRAAVRDRLIARDPTEAVRLPRQRRADASMTIPSIEDVGALVTAADDSFRAFVALCAFTGLRLGEAAAVQVADIDFLRRKLTVARQVQRAGERQVEIKAPKYGSERVIYLPDELTTLLAQHVETHTFGRSGRPLAVPGRARRPAAPEHRRLLVAQDPDGRRRSRHPPARPTPLLRLRPHRGRLRRRHGAARAGSRIGHNDAADLRPPVANGRGSHPRRRRRSDALRDLPRKFCGLFAD